MTVTLRFSPGFKGESNTETSKTIQIAKTVKKMYTEADHCNKKTTQVMLQLSDCKYQAASILLQELHQVANQVSKIWLLI